MLPNTAFTYIYIDGANYRSREKTVVFRGAMADDAGPRLTAAFDSGEHFNAAQIGLIELWDTRVDPEIDHSYHSLLTVMPTAAVPTDARSIEAFLDEVEQAASVGRVIQEERLVQPE